VSKKVKVLLITTLSVALVNGSFVVARRWIVEASEPDAMRYEKFVIPKMKTLVGGVPKEFRLLYVNLDNETYIFRGELQPGYSVAKRFRMWIGRDSQGRSVIGIARDMEWLSRKWTELGLVKV
jgi:hypothetical protein